MLRPLSLAALSLCAACDIDLAYEPGPSAPTLVVVEATPAPAPPVVAPPADVEPEAVTEDEPDAPFVPDGEVHELPPEFDGMYAPENHVKWSGIGKAPPGKVGPGRR